jgi:reductive dehalogenase
MTRMLGFDEIYPCKDGYRRFERRNNAFRRAEREGLKGYDDIAFKLERMVEGIPGFSLIDYAFRDGALTTAKASGSGRGVIDSGFYSWSSLGVTSKPDGVPGWEGSPEEAAGVVRKTGLYYGADDVGFCELDERWIYSHTVDGRPIVFEDVEEGYVTGEKAVMPRSHRWVIAITVPMEFEEMRYAPAAMNPVSSMGYSRMSAVAGSLAEFIRGLGYHAIPCGNDTALSVPIAIQAGLGHLGRHGRLITWGRGPMVRIAKIFTDLPLSASPVAPGGIIEFCEACGKCVQHCPSGAIPSGPRTYEGCSESNNSGTLKWYCDADACLAHWRASGSSCATCFRVCSFTKPPGFHHNVVKWFIRNIPALNGIWVRMDDLMGYGAARDPRVYWEEP